MSRPSLLIVDDSSFNRRQVREAAGEAYLVVAEAADGRSAVMLYHEHRPSVVTMDVMMPEMNGIEAVRAIRLADPDARVVMVSGSGQEDIVRACLEAGASGFLPKPVDPMQLLEALAAARR